MRAKRIQGKPPRFQNVTHRAPETTHCFLALGAAGARTSPTGGGPLTDLAGFPPPSWWTPRRGRYVYSGSCGVVHVAKIRLETLDRPRIACWSFTLEFLHQTQEFFDCHRLVRHTTYEYAGMAYSSALACLDHRRLP